MIYLVLIAPLAMLVVNGSPSCKKDASLKQDPFDLFPPVRQWKHIAKTISHPKQIPNYVRIYLAPFRMIQKAERDKKMHLDTIQRSLLKTLELCIRTADELRLTRKEYQSRKQEDYSAATRRALTILEGSEAKLMSPVLTPKVMRRFMLQRMDDMLWGTKKYAEMQAEKRRFIRSAKHLYRRIQKAPLYLMRHVVKKTMDFGEVQKSLVQDLERFHHDKETAKGSTLDRLVWKIKGTGDDATRPTPAVPVIMAAAVFVGFMATLL